MNSLFYLTKIIHKRFKPFNHKFQYTLLTMYLDYDELKKITKKRLIIVVPKERPYNYTFNGHIHFFPYDWSFINTLKPKTKNFKIYEVYRDFVYIEDLI